MTCCWSSHCPPHTPLSHLLFSNILTMSCAHVVCGGQWRGGGICWADSELRSGWTRRSWELWGLWKLDRGPRLHSAMWGFRTGTQKWPPRGGVSKREFSICPRGAGARYKRQSRGFAHLPPIPPSVAPKSETNSPAPGPCIPPTQRLETLV